MNNIFNTYSSNSYIAQLKSIINLQGPLTFSTLNNIVNQHYYPNKALHNLGLDKFVKTVVNIYFKHITKSDLRPILLLCIKPEITIQHLGYNKNQLVNIINKLYSSTETALSEIITGLSYANRDYYALHFRHLIQQLFNFSEGLPVIPQQSTHHQKFQTPYQQGLNIIKTPSTNIKEGFETGTTTTTIPEPRPNAIIAYKRRYYHLKDAGTLHNINNIEVHEIDADAISGFSGTQEELLIYTENLHTVNSVVNHSKNIIRYNQSHPDLNYYGLIFLIFNDLMNNPDLLKKKIDFNKLTRFIYVNHNSTAIDNLTIKQILAKVRFSDEVAKVNADTVNLDYLDQDELFYFSLELFRNLSDNDLRKVLNINSLLSALHTKSASKYHRFMVEINKDEIAHINTADYTSIARDIKQLIIDTMTNVDINLLVNKSTEEDIKRAINKTELLRLIKARNVAMTA